MKTGITGTAHNRPWGDEFYNKIRSFGFDCNDFNMANTSSFIYGYDDKEFEEYIRKEKSLADSAGICISQVHGPWRWPPMDATPADRAERREKMARSMHAARLLGAKYWVVHPIMPFGVDDMKMGKEAETKTLNIEFMRELLKIAKREGVIICLENMPFLNFSLSSPSAIAKIVEEIGDPSFAMCLDTGHANNSKNFESPAEAMRRFGQYIKALHVHDNKGKGDDHMMPFEGTIDWKDFSAALNEVDFDGVVSLECEPPETLPDNIYEDLFPIYARIARSIMGSK